MKKFLLSFSFLASTLLSIAQNPCATTFDVTNNGGGGACDDEFPGNEIQPQNSAYKRSGLVEIRFAFPVPTGVTPVITAIREITSPGGSGPNIDLRFSLRQFTTTLPARTEAEYCFFGQSNNVNLNNGSGSRYEVDITYITSSGSTSSTCIIVQNPDPIPLPVTFGTFAAERKSSTSVLLKWNTLSEQNNKGFYVQRNSGNGWKEAGFVFAISDDGYSSSNLSYEFKDVNLEKGITQYRILQVDRDGKGRYSDTRSVRGEGTAGKVVVYPNPSNNGVVNVLFENNAARDISINDLSGRVIKQMNNYTDNNLVVENLPAGFYSLRVTDKATNATTIEKIIINKR